MLPPFLQAELFHQHMRRLLRFILFSGYLLGPWAVASAQSTISIDVARVIAVTSCVRDADSTLVVSVINMAAIDSPNYEEYKVHEAEHRRQFAADSTLCPELIRLNALVVEKSPNVPKALGLWVPKLLKLEVGAYCVSVQVPIKRGELPEATYFAYLDMLVDQFRDWLPPEVVLAAWYSACGKLIGGPNDGQGK